MPWVRDGAAEGGRWLRTPAARELSHFSAQEAAGYGEAEIEGFFDGEGPEDVPVAGKVAFGRFKEANAESQGGDERGFETADSFGDYEVWHVEAVQEGQDC